MARAPFQVLVYPYRKNSNEQIEYALMKRSNEGFWQGIAGGGEDNEKPLEAATLCDYNDETLVSNSLVCRAQEKRHVSRISRQAR
jgi:hypothetical protein